jgi:hypothetical protein
LRQLAPYRSLYFACDFRGFRLGLAVTFDLAFTRCCGGVLATTPAARSKRSHASAWNSVGLDLGAVIMTSRKSGKAAMAQLDRLTQAIGYVCVFWAWLEHTIDEAIYSIVAFDSMKMREKEIDEIKNAFAASGDIRSKIKTLRAVAFIRKWDDKWFGKIDKLLNTIDNDLRVKRNMYVHHHWTAPRGRLEAFSKQAKFRRPQAFALELITSERRPIKMREARKLYAAILGSQIKLIGLYLEHQEVQKYIEEEAKKQAGEETAKVILDLARKIAALQAIPAQPTAPEPPSKRPPASKSSKPSRPRKSSRA